MRCRLLAKVDVDRAEAVVEISSNFDVGREVVGRIQTQDEPSTVATASVVATCCNCLVILWHESLNRDYDP
ncbi:MAG: hypothetical protein HOV83_26680 [Catenulispora sp.]|nr:hypothetical protein [Catenulispora sp.]